MGSRHKNYCSSRQLHQLSAIVINSSKLTIVPIDINTIDYCYTPTFYPMTWWIWQLLITECVQSYLYWLIKLINQIMTSIQLPLVFSRLPEVTMHYMMQYANTVYLNTISNWELSVPLCNSVNRCLTLVKLQLSSSWGLLTMSSNKELGTVGGTENSLCLEDE